MMTSLPIAAGETLFGDFTVWLGFDNDPSLPPTLGWRCHRCEKHSLFPDERGGYEGMVAHARTHFPDTEPA